MARHDSGERRRAERAGRGVSSAPRMTRPTPTTYWDYVRVDDLLALQGGLEHDEARLSNEEVLFITVHQVFELWFKLVLRELVAARDLFKGESVAEQELSGVVARLRRVATIFRSATQHFEVVETIAGRQDRKHRSAQFAEVGKIE